MSRSLFSAVVTAMFLLTLAQTVGQAYSASDYEWTSYDGHWYAITLEHSNWVQAESWAQELGGHLVQVDNAAENSWLSAQFQGHYAQGAEGDTWGSLVWIGLEHIGGDKLLNTSWQWSSGAPLTYDPTWWTNPNNYTGIHAYLHTDTHPNQGTWLNYEGHDLLAESYPKGIIELTELNVVPVPGAFVLGSLGLGGASWILRRRRSA